jgi:RNA polymerase sporulation-specific sigma factor
MLENAFGLLAGSLLLMLRVTPGGSFPRPLSREEEEKCLRRWAEGDLEARNRLVEHNLRLVAHIVKKYYAQGGDADDLLSIGTVGLIKGVSSYRADKGVRLATYASRCIENEILMHFRAQRKSAGDVSLSEALDSEDEDGNLSFLDVVAQEDDLAERVGLQELCGKLRRAVDTLLGEREARIVRLRYGLDGGEALTQAETAQRCGISRSYVSRIEKKALEKLRAALGGEN